MAIVDEPNAVVINAVFPLRIGGLVLLHHTKGTYNYNHGVNHGHEHYADRAFVVVVKAPRFGWLLEDF